MRQPAHKGGGRPLPAKLSRPDFPAELPITPRIGEIVDLLRRQQVLIVAGETGSGKTTQLPKACLRAGIGRRGAIAHTQPRRLAARTVAARIAEELGVALGQEVGYAVRFSDRVSAATVVKVMTDGLLLNDIQRDSRLRRYECVIVDEAHERSLNIDFILGCLKRLLDVRRDLKVVITSATIDVDAFAKHFNDAPVVEVSGRGHPVEIVYSPPTTNADAANDRPPPPASPNELLIDCLNTIAAESPAGRRDILVFQTGEREIFESSQLLRRTFADRFDILPLYARLPAAEQQRVFAPGGRQRVVLATNVAETSITVPNIGYVVDPGLARISRYSYRAKLQRLAVEAISQASAAQRAGRCGRIAPGVCYRLYGEDDLAARPLYTAPEIQRTNLAAVVLTMRAFGLGDIERFPFIDPPEARAVRDAVRLLHELQALEDDALTETGQLMARLPVDPRLARMLVEAARTGALAEMLVVVSALAAQDPRLRPLDRREAADRAHALFAESGQGQEEGRQRRRSRKSDFLVFIALWHWLEEARAENTRSAFHRLLEKRFLSPARVREWHALHRQLLLACKDLGMKANTQPADYATLHRALVTGSLGFVGQRRDPAESPSGERSGGKPTRRRWPDYDGPRGLRFRVFPGSALSSASPPWIVAAEISDTGDTFARCVAEIEPSWIEQAARHLAKSTYSSPRWDASRGEAVVDERIAVYGLTVVARRLKRAALVDLAAAREIFVLEALVRRNGRKRLDAPFLDHNERLVRRVEERQAKSRRADLLASETARANFYLARLPADVCSAAAWERYVRQSGPTALAQFEMTEQDLLAEHAGQIHADDFPTCVDCGDVDVPLAYRFAPGEPDDGVTARVDLGLLGQLDADALEWLVPGFFEEKCLALVKGLPKAIRRRLAPAPDRVRAVLPQLQAAGVYRCGKLLPALSKVLHAERGIAVPVGAWRTEALPPHLRINVQVRADRQRVVDQDRDVAALRARLLAKVEGALAGDWRTRHECLALTAFPDQGVPATMAVESRAGRVVVYPVLVDRGSSVDLLIHTTPTGQAALSRGGYARLALLAEARLVRYLRREVERDRDLAMRYAPLGSLAELSDSLLTAAAWFAYFDGRELPATRQAFAARLAAGGLAAVFAEVLDAARVVLAKRFEVARKVQDLDSPAFAESRADLEEQLESVAGARFLTETPRQRLADLPRYLDGMAYRIDNLRGRVQRDRAGIAAVQPWQTRLLALREAGKTEQLDALRFALEEFRIATFSQRVGTRGKMSAKRLEAHFQVAEAAAGAS